LARDFDVAVIGGGVAGLTAGFFAGRYGLSTVVVEQMGSGGQILNSERIENFPGFPGGIAGYELGPLLQEQAEAAGVEMILDRVSAISAGSPHVVSTDLEGDIRARALIIAAGSTLRDLGVDGEERLRGKGVSHCASCDGALFQGQVVAVVGAGDSALDEALVLTQYASKVLILVRGTRLRAQHALQTRVHNNPAIDIRYGVTVTAVLGDEAVQGVRLSHTDGGSEVLPVQGVFVYVGLKPNTEFLEGAVPLDAGGHIPTSLWMETAVPGIFAAGDIRRASARQLVSSAGDGATAAIGAHRYLSGQPWHGLSE
jgi:thioredoxin reductase (NADPH)